MDPEIAVPRMYTAFREFKKSALLTCESTIFIKLHAKKDIVFFSFLSPKGKHKTSNHNTIDCKMIGYKTEFP